MSQQTHTDSSKEEFTKVMERIKASAAKTPAPAKNEVPANIEAARKAAGLHDLQEHEPAAKFSRDTVSELAKQLGQRYSRERTALAKFEVYHQAQAAAIAKTKALVDELAGVLRDGRSIVFYGSVGAGKDHLLCALLYEAAAATIPTHWLSGQEFYGRMRDSMDTGEREELLMERWTRPNVLGISDPIPPTGKPSEWNISQLYRVLDRRYRAMRCSWFSLNAVSLADADAKLSAPVFDRILDGATLVPCFWPSYRERAKK